MFKIGNSVFKKSIPLAVPIVLVGVYLQAMAKQNPPPPKAQDQFTYLIRSLEGVNLFRAYCASCHGLDGRGAGPAASALKSKVPDLTVLTTNNRGKFPAGRVRQIIAGDAVLAAHGSREMPIWGPIFHQVEWDLDWGNVRLDNLVQYLESIQTIATQDSPTGEALYREHCVVCHGADLKGGGTAVYPYRTPPDLTTLALRHGGKFPDSFVSNVLRNGVIMPAHGPAEMPIWGDDFTSARDRLSSVHAADRIALLTNYIKAHQQ